MTTHYSVECTYKVDTVHYLEKILLPTSRFSRPQNFTVVEIIYDKIILGILG
ncbi:MAG: hypothetical protein LBR55_01340 [Bacteroidales bacterium]|jgi:hypothetical protein|nr:hypothetical protein [Bacteroidales bacterium]